MPKRKNPETHEEQAAKFWREAQKLADAGLLTPTEGETALDAFMRSKREKTGEYFCYSVQMDWLRASDVDGEGRLLRIAEDTVVIPFRLQRGIVPRSRAVGSVIKIECFAGGAAELEDATDSFGIRMAENRAAGRDCEPAAIEQTDEGFGDIGPAAVMRKLDEVDRERRSAAELPNGRLKNVRVRIGAQEHFPAGVFGD